ncbi:MAG TPA: zf-HC2 domain-containing protein [Gaiellaceae bacterium]|nr:zf-HC2 domain-containing protein [Gaiellaceae bacterium]
MTRFRTNFECEQARAWAALAPDDELNELETASLRAHLRTCPPCARFAAQVDRITTLVRTQHLVVPRQRILVHETRRHSRLVARARPVAAAAAVALMALGVAARAPLPVDSQDRVTLSGSTVSPEADRREMEALRRQQLNIFASDVKLRPLPIWSSSRAV